MPLARRRRFAFGAMALLITVAAICVGYPYYSDARMERAVIGKWKCELIPMEIALNADYTGELSEFSSPYGSEPQKFFWRVQHGILSLRGLGAKTSGALAWDLKVFLENDEKATFKGVEATRLGDAFQAGISSIWDGITVFRNWQEEATMAYPMTRTRRTPSNGPQ